MERDDIAVVELDQAGQLHVIPSQRSFPYIYREAMEVHWDPQLGSLHSPVPREWSYQRWFQQILSAALAQGCELVVAPSTEWRNVAPGIKAEVLQLVGHGA